MKKSILFCVALLCCIMSYAQGSQRTDTLSFAILGDSYSTFEGYLTPDTNFIWYFTPENPQLHTKNDVRKVEETWWYQTIKAMNGRLEVNNSFSGSTICYSGYKKDKDNGGDYSDRAFVTRSNKLGNPDVILVCGATNDSWAGAPIGEYVYGNQTREQLYSFRPAMAKLLADLRTNYPCARIVFILNSELKESINESVHTICRHYSVPCIDLHDIDKQGGHPSVAGMKAFAEQVVSFLKSQEK